MKPNFVRRGEFSVDEDYRKWIGDIKHRLQSAQIKAAIRVNTSMLEFYWSLGRDIVSMKAEQKWGAGIVEQLSLDLKDAFPNQTGFSSRNIWYAKKWYLFYNEQISKLHQVGAEFQIPENFGLVPWRHHIEIITKCKSAEEALFYIQISPCNSCQAL